MSSVTPIVGPPQAHYASIQAMVAAAINEHWKNFKCSDPDKVFAWVIDWFERSEQDCLERLENDGPLLAMLADTHQDELRLKVRKIRWIRNTGEAFVKEKIRKYLENRKRELSAI